MNEKWMETVKNEWISFPISMEFVVYTTEQQDIITRNVFL